MKGTKKKENKETVFGLLFKTYSLQKPLHIQ